MSKPTTNAHPAKDKQAKMRKPVLGDEGVYCDGPAYREAMKNWHRRDNPNLSDQPSHADNAGD